MLVISVMDLITVGASEFLDAGSDERLWRLYRPSDPYPDMINQSASFFKSKVWRDWLAFKKRHQDRDQSGEQSGREDEDVERASSESRALEQIAPAGGRVLARSIPLAVKQARQPITRSTAVRLTPVERTLHRETYRDFQPSTRSRLSLCTKSARRAAPAVPHGQVTPKAKRRRKAGQLALQEIRKLQKTVNLLIPKASFLRLTKEVLQRRNAEMRIAARAFESLQISAEEYAIQYFEQSNRYAIHRNHVTVMPKDFELTRFTRKNFPPMAFELG
jgi:histone H3